MNQVSTINALIAEDEPILALTLQHLLLKLWPELNLCNIVENGIEGDYHARGVADKRLHDWVVLSEWESGQIPMGKVGIGSAGREFQSNQ